MLGFRSLIVAIFAALIGSHGTILADGPGDNHPDHVRPVPPVGIELTAEQQAQFQERLQKLQQQIDQLSASGNENILRLLPDVEIFHRAVQQAVEYREMFHPADVNKAHRLLDEGIRRANQLAAGSAPWTRATGLVVRGFRSRLDGTVQPYGLVIPKSYSEDRLHHYRLDLWFHGRGERSVELQFLHQRMNQIGQYAPQETIVLHPFARYSNGNKFAGEVDTLEALAHVQSHYRIDDERISIRGFSMGGAACWHLAVHYADRWFAANPGAGFSETPEFLKSFQKETLHPPWWEEKLWRLYDCPLWVENLRHCPTIAYSGEIDKQKQAADVMARAFAAIGIQMTHIIGPGTAHKIHPDAKVEIEQRMASLAEQGRERFPRHVHLVTYTLKYNRMHWVTIDRLGEHWERAEVLAKIAPDGASLELDLTNVEELSLDFPAGRSPFLAEKVQLHLTEHHGKTLKQGLTLPGVTSDRSWSVHLKKQEGRWTMTAPGGRPNSPADGRDGRLVKRHDLQGPIDDAFMDSFLFVRPTGGFSHPQVEQWVNAELDRAILHWRKQMRGDVRVKSDTQITPQDIAENHLILWGDPRSNDLIGQILKRLPIEWNKESLSLAGKRFDSATHVPILIYPNPLNPRRYVVLNSSLTYREYDYLNNARQTPKLPDWAIVDLSEPPGTRWAGKIVAADFFDEFWQLKLPHRDAK